MISSPSLRWGILGTGMIARRFASQLRFSQTGTLAAIASRTLVSAEAFTAEVGGVPCAGYASLLERGDVDAVYVALPNQFHVEWTLAALAAGKHVLCEKPLAPTAAEARQLFAAAQASGRLLVEAMMYRAHPQTREFFAAIREGLIGEVRLAHCHFTFQRPVSPDDARYQAGGGGGSLYDVGCYCIDWLRSVVGEEPVAMNCLIHPHELGVDDYATAQLGFSGGALATFTCGMTVVSDQTAHLAGTNGRIMMPRFWQAAEGYTHIDATGASRFVAPIETGRPLYALEADAFAEVLGGASSWHSPENTVANLMVLEGLLAAVGVSRSSEKC
jgi:D-xylose 1-dehydrogenase (NADP+, D-xylono-1,5-lactone-forming)